MKGLRKKRGDDCERGRGVSKKKQRHLRDARSNFLQFLREGGYLKGG